MAKKKTQQDDACPFPPNVELPKENQVISARSMSLKQSYSLRTRTLGLVIGAFLIAAVFLLPFGYRGARPLTLYDVFQQNSYLIREASNYVTPTMYMFSADFVLLTLAGLLGAFPKLSGLIVLIVISSFSVVSIWFFGQESGYGVGYYAIWILSLAILCNALWRKSLSRVMHKLG